MTRDTDTDGKGPVLGEGGGGGERWLYSPDNHNDKIQQVPAVAEVSIGVKEQPIGYDF